MVDSRRQIIWKVKFVNRQNVLKQNELSKIQIGYMNDGFMDF